MKRTFKLAKLYKELNEKYFGGILGDVKFEGNPRLWDTFAAVATIYTYKNLCGEKVATIKFDTKYDWDEKDIRRVLLHEMIHYYIFVKLGRRLIFPHGLPFIWIMLRINRKYDEHIKLYWI